MAVNYQAVKSSDISEVGYDADTQTLYVRFNSGAEYAYDGVPPEEHENLVNAGSVGSALNDSIKGQYPYRRV